MAPPTHCGMGGVSCLTLPGKTQDSRNGRLKSWGGDGDAGGALSPSQTSRARDQSRASQSLDCVPGPRTEPEQT